LTGLKLQKQCYACSKQQTNKQTNEKEGKKQRKRMKGRKTCAEQDSMKVKRGVKMHYF
jgi:hypothetical protein